MLTFFRQIRRSLLDKRSIRKYLFYAIGEIALVVIGILIALQINNWNQNRINAQKELDMMRVLKKEFALADRYMDNRMEDYTNGFNYDGRKLLELTRTWPLDIEIDSFSRYLMGTFNIGGFSPPSAKFQQVVDGEGMDLIRYDSLQTYLIRYQNQLELAYSHDQQMRGNAELVEFWNQNLVVQTIVKHSGHGWFDLFESDEFESRFEMDLQQAIKNPEFENIVVNRMMLLYSANKRLTSVQWHIRRIMEIIDEHYRL